MIFARSVAGVQPRVSITWFQAQQALANSGKRLPTNAEWQMAVAATPDDANCNVESGSIANTGAFGNCVSDWGAFDMVGNAFEWVAEWVPLATDCPGWGSFSDDDMCHSGASTTGETPGVMIRGGAVGAGAGPLAVISLFGPSHSSNGIGFRGSR